MSDELEEEAEDWAPRFFAAYASRQAYGNINMAAKASGVHPNAVKARLANDPAFRALVVQADTELDEALEFVAYDHAINGTTREVYQHGAVVGDVTEFDHKLLMRLLETRMPEKYHLPTRIEHVNPNTPGAFTFQLGEKPLALGQGEGGKT